MLDTVQLVLLCVIVVVSLLLFILGIQVFFILKEFRRTLRKANSVLDNAHSITNSVSTPISHLSDAVSNIKAASLISVLKVVRSILSHDKK